MFETVVEMTSLSQGENLFGPLKLFSSSLEVLIFYTYSTISFLYSILNEGKGKNLIRMHCDFFMWPMIWKN